MQGARTRKPKYLSVADLVAPRAFYLKFVWCGIHHPPTCRKNRIGGKPQAPKIEKLTKKDFWFKCLGQLIRSLVRLGITGLSCWGPSEHGSACVWSLHWSTPRLVCSAALRLPWCTAATGTYTVKCYGLLEGRHRKLTKPKFLIAIS